MNGNKRHARSTGQILRILSGGMTRFIALAVCLSALGGYQLSQLFLEVNVSSAKRSVQLLEIEEYLDEAAIGLGRQIQEWKDMLLRAEHGAIYNASARFQGIQYRSAVCAGQSQGPYHRGGNGPG